MIAGWRTIKPAMDRLTIRIQKDHPDARLPEFAHGPGEDTGMDLFSAEEVILSPGTWASVGTGLKIELPPGYDGQLRPRSGLASEYGVTLLNAPGTIDPGYRGEVRVLMINHGDRGYTIWPGDKIAQLVVGSYAAVEWEVAEQLTESKRGDGGFGSTGD